MNSLSRVEINTLAIKNNIQQFRKILPKNYKIAGVVKSNAYGHGMIPLAGFLERNSLVEYFAVANDLEALALRKNNIKLPIIVLSYWNEKNLQNLVSQNIELGIYSHEQIKMLTGLKAKVKVHVKIDTGMNRLGIKPEEVEKYITEIKKNANIKLQGIFSHFPVADENEEFTKKQFLQFKEIVAKISRQIDIPFIHTANSAGALFMDETCNLLRLGIAMYGLQPSIKNPQFNIQPVLTWKTKVIQIKIGTGEHDLTLKAKNISKWLKEGNRIKLDLFLAGRTKYMDKDFLKGRFDRILNLVTEDFKIADGPKKSPKGMSLILEKDK